MSYVFKFVYLAEYMAFVMICQKALYCNFRITKQMQQKL